MVEDELSADELAAALTGAGYPTTTRQLERWRDAGLLKPSSRGVAAEHTRADIQRCVAIHRALAEKDDLKQAGQTLWAAGFEMPPSIWRPAIERADWLSAPIVRRLTRRFDADLHPQAPTIGKWFKDQETLPGVLGKIRRKLPGADEADAFVGVMMNVATSSLAGFEHEEVVEGQPTTKESLLRGFGFDRGANDAVLEQRLQLGKALQPSLINLDYSFEGPRAWELTDEELCAARDDIRNGLKSMYCLHQAVAWFMGNEAFGLKLLATLTKSLGPLAINGLTPALARLRRIPGAIISSAEIADMAARAEAAWLMSNYFFELQSAYPEFRKICGPAEMKLSFRDSVSHRNFLKILSERNFPEPRFEPWALWQSTSRTKKMPPGLLVMSIGAPSKSDLAIVQSASEGMSL